MKIPSRDTVEALRREYPEGTKIKLISMDDISAPPIGTTGKVTGVDDMGDIMVQWDNGSALSVIYGVDKIDKIHK